MEDDPGDALMVEIVLADQGVPARLRVVTDGVSALAYLRGAVSAAPTSRPSLILLDLHLPRQDGRALLAELKADAKLRSIPVVVLTGSASSADITACYDLQASAFVTKPTDLHQFAHVIRRIERFFLTEVRLPIQGSSEQSSTVGRTTAPFDRHAR
ncbi:response regulator [Frankia umida]|uniref:response regulator n=1 Tax=Frankia umida TaxID=573489 RepID=UPI0027E4ACD3|nr:response regulator [Frankia umida]